MVTMCKNMCPECCPPKAAAHMPWSGDIAHTTLPDGRVVPRGSQEEADYLAASSDVEFARVMTFGSDEPVAYLVDGELVPATSGGN